MNFILKETDSYECFNRSGKVGVRIIDAKFALPKTPADESGRFVCLDMPDYPSEHDDINIVFESEQGPYFPNHSVTHADPLPDRTNFLDAMPGSIREPTRMMSVRR